jgi:prophage tail gpP-like protein
MTDDLTLLVNGARLSGWTSIRVTRGIERCPSDFDIEMTERYPGEATAFVVQPGDSCQVLLGNDVVITGYVDRLNPSIDAGAHTVRVAGRGKCADLVDCAAEWPGGQIKGSVLAIAKKLAQPYGIFSDGRPSNPIVISANVSDLGPVIPQFSLILGTTAYSLIERICRYAALLAYEEADGNLLLTRAGSGLAASGIVLGKNVQRASIEYSMDQRYSEVYAYIQSFDTFQDTGDLGNLKHIRVDPNVARHRRMVVIAESGDSDFHILEQRAAWEIARRFGRSNQLHVTVDSWRDGAGVLWTPNTIVPVSIPALKLPADAKWLISEVTYSRNSSSGTTADLVLMPPQAFMPQPIVLQPGYLDVKAPQ